MRLDYDDIQTLVELANGKGINDQISCFDFVSSICNENDQWIVEVFVEPVGHIKVKGKCDPTVDRRVLTDRSS